MKNNSIASLFDTYNQKDMFRQIKNYLAGRFVGATRERALLEEVVKCYFCKFYSEKHENGRLRSIKDAFELSKIYREIFSVIKSKLSFIFPITDELQLDPVCLQYINNELNKIDFKDSKRDSLGDMYEVFIGTGIREEEGQFFTPQNGIDLLVDLINPKPGEKIIDPAAGAGGFLSSAFKHLLSNGTTINDAIEQIYGIEKDTYLAKLAFTRLSIISLSESKVVCGDSLAWVDNKNQKISINKEGFFDIVLTNPPFGKNIVAASKEVLKTFDLGFDWKFDDSTQKFVKNGKMSNNVPPQVLFIERCLKLLKENGRLGMVVPESLITSKLYSYVVQYMQEFGDFDAIMGMPEDFFKTSGKGGTHTKACLILFKKGIKKNEKLFMAEAKWCGHDSRGKNIDLDDLPKISSNYLKSVNNEFFTQSNLGYTINKNEIENNILSPRYYNPEVKESLYKLDKTHNVIKFGELVEKGIIEVKTGNEIGKLAYGTGDIPFVRTSDISTWEIKIDPKHGVSQDVYNTFAKKQDVRENDILMVKDGTYLIGTCAIITKYDSKIIYQSHLYKIRVLKRNFISPYLLLAVLTSEPVQQQIKAKRFTQDIIDSLGSRINELILPIPKDEKIVKRIEENVKKVIDDRTEARELARQACLDVVSCFAD